MGEAREIDTGSDRLLYRIEEDGVGVVTFNDPERRNPLGGELRPIFRHTIDAAAQDADVRCLRCLFVPSFEAPTNLIIP